MGINISKINKGFKKFGEKLIKKRFIFLGIITLLTMIAFFGLGKMSMDVSPDSWFDKKDPFLQQKEKFEERFGNNEYVAFLIESKDVFNYETLKVIRNLGDVLVEKVPYVSSQNPVISLTEFEYIQGSNDKMEIIDIVPSVIPKKSEKLEMIRKKVLSKKNLVNKIVSDDSKQTWLILKLKPFPDDFDIRNPPSAMVAKEIKNILKMPEFNKKGIKIRATGAPILELEETEFLGKEMGQRIILALIASIILLMITLRSFRGVIIPSATMILSILIPFGFMGLLGIKIQMMSVTLPLYLGIGVSVGYSIHIFNTFKRGLAITRDRKKAAIYAIEHTGWPLLFTALTTIVAFLSMIFTNVMTIRWIGYTCGAVISTVYIYTLILLPIFLSFGKVKKNKNIKEFSKLDIFFMNVGEWGQKNITKILFVMTIFLGIIGFGITKLNVDVDMMKTMGLKVPYVKEAYETGNSKIGTIYSYDITLPFKDFDSLKNPKNMKNMEKIIKYINKQPLTKRTTSFIDILKELNQVVNDGNKEYYKIPDSKETISQLMFLYDTSGGDEARSWINYAEEVDDLGFDIFEKGVKTLEKSDDKSSYFRIQVEMSDFKSKEFMNEYDLITKKVREYFPDMKPEFTGGATQFAKMSQYLVKGQLISLFVAIGVIAVLLMIVFGSIKVGLIGMIPNVLPLVVIGGVMGYFDFPLDFMTVTIMPMIIGISVDDTIHFINQMKFNYEKTGEYDIAIKNTFLDIGKAITLTTVILIFTYGMFISSPVKMYVNLGITVICGLSFALFTDYFLTPFMIKKFKAFDK
ncbi:efflux RND transporter permease subunit [Haliovirga abyssi]|uniref:Membrane protein n=1 Tax=Haliovirga abyssi TaxID=2996794 RepID=A0AAU9D667_9FUSO|nr:MMPL family transporter [Haliovirga abyssi]BDU51469.1 membrane protein [Haliovirga abyssi]